MDPLSGMVAGARAARLSFWLPFAGVSVFILSVFAGATKAAGHPILMFVVVGIATLVCAGGLALGIAALRRMKIEGRRGIAARALCGVALNAGLLGLMLLLAVFLIHDAQRTSRAWEQAAELEAREWTARVGGGAALEKALAAVASQNFAAQLSKLQTNYDAAWTALANPPVLEMATVKSLAELQARAAAVGRLVQAAEALQHFAENMPDIYGRELQRHKLSPDARKAELAQFMGILAPASPTFIALSRTQRREGESLLRVIRLLEDNWGRWEYMPATGEIAFKDPAQADAYSVAYKEFHETSLEAGSLKKQLKTVGTAGQ